MTCPLQWELDCKTRPGSDSRANCPARASPLCPPSQWKFNLFKFNFAGAWALKSAFARARAYLGSAGVI